MTVYVTGRSVETGNAIGWDGAPLPGTIHETAAAISATGGRGIAVQCDHAKDDQVAALFERIQSESGRTLSHTRDRAEHPAPLAHASNSAETPKPFSLNAFGHHILEVIRAATCTHPEAWTGTPKIAIVLLQTTLRPFRDCYAMLAAEREKATRTTLLSK